MKVILCLDNRNGIMFNNRRLSKDKKIIEDIENNIKNETLFCSYYSKELFQNSNISINTIEDKLSIDKMLKNYVFVEDIIPDYKNIEEMIIYYWNRDYPSDIKFSPDFDKYNKVYTLDFEGNSHETITKKVYIKKGEELDGNNN